MERLSRLYGKTLRRFPTLDEADLDPPGARNDVARRIYQRVAEALEQYHTMLERVVDDVLGELEASEGLDQGNGRRLRARR